MTTPAVPSTIPAAIDALVAALRARPALAAPVRVVDGMPRFQITDMDVISIGGVPGEPVATGEQSPAGLGAQRREERYALAVHCSSSRGGDDQKAVRDQAFAFVAEVAGELRGDPTLGGVVRLAQLAGSISLIQTDEDTKHLGVFAEVSFQIDCQARI